MGMAKFVNGWINSLMGGGGWTWPPADESRLLCLHIVYRPVSEMSRTGP